jgi:hypothetical protein
MMNPQVPRGRLLLCLLLLNPLTVSNSWKIKVKAQVPPFRLSLKEMEGTKSINILPAHDADSGATFSPIKEYRGIIELFNYVRTVDVILTYICWVDGLNLGLRIIVRRRMKHIACITIIELLNDDSIVTPISL